jgi:hypothetical protein
LDNDNRFAIISHAIGEKQVGGFTGEKNQLK